MATFASGRSPTSARNCSSRPGAASCLRPKPRDPGLRPATFQSFQPHASRDIDERHLMSSTRAAVVLGASGSVGNALIKELIRNGAFKPIVTLVRRSQPDQVAMARDAGIELRETLVPAMDPAGLEIATTEAIRPLKDDAVGLSVLGVGAGTARLTIDEHRAIDVQLNAAFARGLKASGRVKHLAFMSAVGASPTARATGSGAAGTARYARVKGEAEEAVKASGPAVVSIFRPAMIIGSQHTPDRKSTRLNSSH